MVGKKCWILGLLLGLLLPFLGGCGNQRDQKQPNRGLDRPKYVKDKEGT
jgi:hypothetical protein